jgi:hypothetical protein
MTAGGLCREGHVSDEPDYCSVCGVAMTAPARAAPPALAARITPLPASVKNGLPRVCPECAEPRAADARFCEVCRFDFVARRAGPPPAGARPKSTPPPAPLAAVPAPAMPASAARFELEITVDPSLDTEPDPESPCPIGVPAVTVPIDRAELLVGRRDDRRDIHPDLPVQDPGASRRHAKFVVLADGALALHDLASTNGTKLNGVEVASGSRTPLAAGDVVTVGRWTRILVRNRT